MKTVLAHGCWDVLHLGHVLQPAIMRQNVAESPSGRPAAIIGGRLVDKRIIPAGVRFTVSRCLTTKSARVLGRLPTGIAPLSIAAFN